MRPASIFLIIQLSNSRAYGNNYYDNDIQYIFLGVEEVNDENNKAIPKLPILGHL